MSARGIGALERGDRRTPQRETVVLLADALQLLGERRAAFESAANPVGSRRAGPGTVAAGPWPARLSSNLPLSVTSFIGREDDVDDIKRLVREQRLVTLTGAGGIGKTRTAFEVAATLNDTVHDGVWVVDLAAVSDPARVLPAFAAALGVQETAGTSPLDALLGYLERKQLLMVVDNCEHVIGEARDAIAALLQRCRDVRVLATSREALNIAGERRYIVRPLPSFDAALLFAERAAAADNRFALSDDNAQSVAELCRRLDGIPLALELAAARVGMFTLPELLRLLDDRFRVLTGGDRAAQPRQRAIRTLIDWSYDLLSVQEQALFRALAIFAGGFTLDLVTALYARIGGTPEQAFELLASLVDKSLVQADPEDGRTRYRLLETMQHYAREHLVAQNEYAAAAGAHADAFFALAAKLEREYGSAADDVWRALATPELENWRSALQWSLTERNDPERGPALIAALRWVWLAYAQEDGRRWARLALAAPEDVPATIVARLHLYEAHMYAWLGRYRASYDAAERARAHFPAEAESGDLAEAGWRAGNALVQLGDLIEGEAQLRDALERFRALGAPKMVCWVLVCIGLARAHVHDMDGAKACYAEALAIARACRFRGAATVIWGNLAETEYRAGDAEAALRCAAEALAGSRDYTSPLGCAIHLANMTMYLVSLGRFEEARAAAREALAFAGDLRADVVATIVVQHLAAAEALEAKARGCEDVEPYVVAARLSGFVDARFAALDAKRDATDIMECDAYLPVLRERLGADALAAHMADGRVLDADHAVAEALAGARAGV